MPTPIIIWAISCALHRPAEAETAYRRAIHLQPDHADAHNNLGHLLQERYRYAEAEAAYRQALRCRPNDVDAHNNLGSLLQELQRYAEAEAAYRQALHLDPGKANAHNNLSVLLQKLKRYEEAESAVQQALRLHPDDADTHINRGILMEQMGRLDEAEASHRRALLLDPDAFRAYDSLLFMQNYREDTDRGAALADARRYGQRVAEKARPFHHRPNPADSRRRLRIGLVSGDLRNHPVGYFLQGVIPALNAEEVELFAYATSDLEDALTRTFQAILPHWRTVVGLSDIELAQLIRRDAIDILVDLAGHTAYNRLGLFAWKPAPVQLTWLGYFATTGVEAMDYILGDPINLPADEATHFVETPWPLPDCSLCFTPPVVAPAVAALPACTNGFITFGCFNRAAKINAAVIGCWADILRAVPDSRLFLKNQGLADARLRHKTAEQFQRANIAPERLLLEGSQAFEDYLECYHRVDLALDPFPYPGGMTSVEGLWMGVPFLTRKGHCFIAHQGETILVNAGLSDWIARDVDDYVAKAVAFARDPSRLATLRAGLRQQVSQSPLCDVARFASNLTQAWQGMWHRWCHAEPGSALCKATINPAGERPGG